MARLRFHDLVDELRIRFPADYWIERFGNLGNDFDHLNTIYDDALSCLDEESWKLLSSKLKKKFKEPETQRGKTDFFSTLNEALAYRYILERGGEEVCLIKERNDQRVPDISYMINGCRFYCEVKTLGISNDQLQLYEKVEMFDPTIFESLTRDFFNRLKDKIENAQGDRASTMVYLFVDFDDFTKVHLDTYRFQIQDFFLSYFPRLHICARSGLTGTEFLTHNLDTLELGD